LSADYPGSLRIIGSPEEPPEDEMAAYFSGTMNALKRGITKMTCDAAIRNIENWEDSLQDIEITGCKAILRDLAALKKQLDVSEPDGDRVRNLMAKLASQTVAIAEKSDNRYRDKIADLGEALAHAAEESDDEDATDDRSQKSAAGRGRTDGQGRAHEADGKFASSSSNSSKSTRSSSDDGQEDSQGRQHDPDGRFASKSASGGSQSSSSSTRGSSRSSGQGEVQDRQNDGRLKENRDRGVSMANQDDDEDDRRGSRPSGNGSRSSSGQGEVQDRSTDGRLKENRDRGGSSTNGESNGRSGQTRSR
jgi:hypothetical protein